MSILKRTATFGQAANGESFLISPRCWARPRSSAQLIQRCRFSSATSRVCQPSGWSV